MTTNAPRDQATPTTAAHAALWASAFVILAMILFRAGDLRGTAAHGEMVADSGSDFVVMTADGGSDDVLLVLDQRNEELFVYGVKNQQEVDLYERYKLARLFHDARANARGG